MEIFNSLPRRAAINCFYLFQMSSHNDHHSSALSWMLLDNQHISLSRMVEKDVGVKFKIYRDDTKVPEEKPATAKSLLEISLIILESVLGKRVVFVKCSLV